MSFPVESTNSADKFSGTTIENSKSILFSRHKKIVLSLLVTISILVIALVSWKLSFTEITLVNQKNDSGESISTHPPKTKQNELLQNVRASNSFTPTLQRTANLSYLYFVANADAVNLEVKNIDSGEIYDTYIESISANGGSDFAGSPPAIKVDIQKPIPASSYNLTVMPFANLQGQSIIEIYLYDRDANDVDYQIPVDISGISAQVFHLTLNEELTDLKIQKL